MNLNFALLLSLLAVVACGKSTSSSKNPTNSYSENVGKECSIVTLAEEFEECLVGMEIDSWLVVGTDTQVDPIWMETDSMLMVSSVKNQTYSFNELSKRCSEIKIPAFLNGKYSKFVVPTFEQATDLLAAGMNRFYPMNSRNFLTSTKDWEGWVKVMSGSTGSEYGHVDPSGYISHGFCVSTVL